MAIQTKHDLVGQRFGRLLVTGKADTYVSPNGTRKAQWVAACSCGSTTTVQGARLRSGLTKSCGCLRHESNQRKARYLAAASKGKPKNRILKPYQWLFNILLKASLKYEERCDISYSEFLEFTKVASCSYCGEEVQWPSPYSSNRTRYGYNLDRKNNDVGYTKDNVVICCRKCNVAKGNRYTFAEWSAMTGALRSLHR